ncbi:sigma-70 family RNA polymerase sigma factor [Pelagibacteraceae bacterium]|nr:sigma-70 family RNA polymerase sigma factor [Pelagibacteraceae bacterium]
MNNSDLNNLMVKINEGRDQMAFSSLFDFLAPKIKGYYIQNGLSSDNAEELTQEVMSVIWAKSDKFDVTKSAVSTWVYRIARNKKIDFYRKNKGILINEDDIREFLYENNYDNPIKESEIKDTVNKIDKELDKDQRKIIKMNFFENKSHKKIAEELEIPLGTVKSRIRHILIKMQRFL